MFEKLFPYFYKPELYQKSPTCFWQDPHISSCLLEAHLNPDSDAATRNTAFIDASAAWIASIAPPSQFPRLLDIGCGPGIYTEKFQQQSYCVTGIDFSDRSITHAKKSAAAKNVNINYYVSDYLEMTFDNEFDLITLIYCDLGALSPHDGQLLLEKIHTALKPGGRFIFDVFTPEFHKGTPESKTWHYHQSGFWKETPHLCLDSFYRYDEAATVLNQTIVVSEATIDCYNIWEHTFTTTELVKDLSTAGFSAESFYGDIAGAVLKPDSKTICTVAQK